MSAIKEILLNIQLLKDEIQSLKNKNRKLVRENQSLKTHLKELLTQDNSLKF